MLLHSCAEITINCYMTITLLLLSSLKMIIIFRSHSRFLTGVMEVDKMFLQPEFSLHPGSETQRSKPLNPPEERKMDMREDQLQNNNFFPNIKIKSCEIRPGSELPPLF